MQFLIDEIEALNGTNVVIYNASFKKKHAS